MMKVYVNFRNLHSNNYFLLYTHEIYAKTKNFRNILLSLLHCQNNVLGLPVSPSATGTCEQRLRFHQNRSAAEPWLLWTGAEISSSSSKKKFDMTFLEVLELQLFSVCNKHIDLVLWKNGPLGKILTFSTEYVCWAGKQRLKNVRETSQTPWWMAADSL